MPEINLPTAGKQNTILANTNDINANVNANKSTLATVNANTSTTNTNLGTPTSGASSSTGANAHAKLNYILNKTSKNLLNSSPITGEGLGLLDYDPDPYKTYGTSKFSITGPCAMFNLKIAIYTGGDYNSSLKITIDGQSWYFKGSSLNSGSHTVLTVPFLSFLSGISVVSNKSATQNDNWKVTYSHYYLL